MAWSQQLRSILYTITKAGYDLKSNFNFFTISPNYDYNIFITVLTSCRQVFFCTGTNTYNAFILIIHYWVLNIIYRNVYVTSTALYKSKLILLKNINIKIQRSLIQNQRMTKLVKWLRFFNIWSRYFFITSKNVWAFLVNSS